MVLASATKSAVVNVQLGYYWTVEGGIAGTVVPNLIDVYASVDATNGNDHSDSNALATIDIRSLLQEVGPIFVNCTFGQGVVSTCSNSFSQTLRINAVDDLISSVFLRANASARGARSALVFIDPHIYVEPSFLNASQYSIRLSAGIGNSLAGVAAIPEPRTYAMMLAGIGLLGLVSRRLKNKTANARPLTLIAVSAPLPAR